MAKRTAKKTSRHAGRPVTTRKRTKSAATKPSGHVPTKGLYGWITHTELFSSDPPATRAWCATVLGWTFRPSFATPEGEYHLFAYAKQGGGGIRPVTPDGPPGTMAFVHVADAQESFDKALAEGAEEVLKPTRVMDGATIAIVRAPGGVPIGLSGP